MQLFKERGNPLLRFLDRYVGVTLLYFFALFRRKRKLPKQLTKVGIIKLSGIGDVVLLARWIRAFKAKFSEVEVVFFSGKDNAGMASFVKADRHEILSVFSPIKALKQLRNECFSVLIDGESWSRISALLSLFSKAQFLIGYKTPGQWKHWGLDKAVDYSFECHEIKNIGALFAPLGIQHITLKPLYKFKGLIREKLCIVHLFPGGSRGYLKQWPARHWQKLFGLLESLKLDVYATGTEKDWEGVNSVIKGYSVKNVCGKYSLIQMGELLQSAQCVVSVDTGIMHLAAALDVRVVALHGPTSFDRWGGIGKSIFPLEPNLEYQPCIQLGFEKKCSVGKCMQAISPMQVFSEVKKCLESVPSLASAADGKIIPVCDLVGEKKL